MSYRDDEQDEWKTQGSEYRRVLEGFVELCVQPEGRRWRWTIFKQRRPLQSAAAGSAIEAMAACKAAWKERTSKEK